MKMMKAILAALATIAAVWLLLYVAGAVACASTDIRQWDELTRGMVAFIGGAASPIGGAVCFLAVLGKLPQ